MVSVLACLAMVNSQEMIRLWEGDAPMAAGSEAKDIPTLTRFPAQGDKRNAAMVIFPGGGYGGLADHEGSGYAAHFAALGFECFVLKYRLGSDGYRNPVIRFDAERAIRMVRWRAKDWNVNPEMVGVIGSSAGGHLAATVVTQFSPGVPEAVDRIESVSSRPDFAILCYPVITMGPLGHRGSRDNLLGEDPTESLIDAMSAEKNVRADTPPCFLWHTADDSVVPVENSLMFAQALAAKNVPFEIHVYDSGPHGLGLGASEGPSGQTTHPWTGEAIRWLNALARPSR